MAASSGDPLARWIEETVKDNFGARAASNATGGPRTAGQSRQVGDDLARFLPITPLPVIPAGLGLGSDRLTQMLTELSAPAATHAVDALSRCHHWLPWSLSATAAAVVIDVFRLPAHRHRDAIATQVLEATLVQPRRVSVPVWWPGIIAPRRAVVTLPRRGTVLKDDRLDLLTAVLDKAANPAADPEVGRLMQRFDLQAWTMRVRHVPASVWRRYDRLIITRHPVPVDTRTPELRRIDTALEALRQLPDARATVVRDGDDHAGYDITYSPTLLPGRAAFQQQIRELLVSFLGSPVDGDGTPTGWMWTVGFLPESDLIRLRLAAPLPKYVRHEPVTGGYLQLEEKQRHRIPYATAAGDLVINWNLGWSSSVPHFLGVGPTGGGKTSLIRTLVSELVARGIPVIGADPKMIELVGLIGWPGVAAVVYSLRRMVLLISALHAEMHARLEHCMRTRMPHQELQMLGVVLDEFFIMSGLFNRARRYKGEDPDLVALANLVNNHDPLGKVADLAAMGRSAGIRLIIGVQRPDADIFGDGAGSVRDNFRSRASLSNLSLNGALMMWDDARVGRDLDASVPGRATVCTDDGSPIQAQIWWTPDLDQHPRKWEALSQDDRDIVDALRPEGDLEYIWYSDELIEFVAESATPGDTSGPVGEPSPEPVGGLAPESDAVDDGVRAAKLVAGDRIHLDDGSTVTVAKVTKPRGGKVLVTVEGEGRVQTQIELDRNDVVLADKPVHLTESAGE